MSLFAAGAAGLLLPILRTAGANLLARFLERDNPPVLEAVVTGVAGRLGVEPTPAAIAARYAADPAPVLEAARAVEDQRSPEEWALLAGEAATRRELLARDDARESAWSWAWRPAWMWLLGVLWTWTLVVAPILRAGWLPDLAAPDVGSLLTVTGLYVAMYMGGHTVKSLAETRWGAK